MQRFVRIPTLVLLVLVSLSAAAHAAPGSPAPRPAAAAVACAPRSSAPLELVESAPVETTLEHACIRNAREVWLELFGSARETIDLASFYAAASPGEALDGVIDALAAARARGVRVRVVLDARLSNTYPETWRRLAAAGLEVRTIDAKASMGGVMHAKYFVVDGRRGFSGSQNFDWRSLAHIQELGVRFDDRDLAAGFEKIFEIDWRLAAGEDVRSLLATGPTAPAAGIVGAGGKARLVASPTGWLPAGVPWDEPALVALMDGARSTLRLQVLTLGTKGHGGERYTVLTDALARAARRGVRVEILVSDWCKGGCADDVEALAATPGIEVRMITIPVHSSGPIEFARVAHTKILVADGATVWVGSSNWGRDYFYESRNAGLVVTDAGVVGDAVEVFDGTWASRYAHPVGAATAVGAVAQPATEPAVER